jgi:hypothetical protein
MAAHQSTKLLQVVRMLQLRRVHRRSCSTLPKEALNGSLSPRPVYTLLALVQLQVAFYNMITGRISNWNGKKGETLIYRVTY